LSALVLQQFQVQHEDMSQGAQGLAVPMLEGCPVALQRLALHFSSCHFGQFEAVGLLLQPLLMLHQRLEK
jgi:hypothetical protein